MYIIAGGDVRVKLVCRGIIKAAAVLILFFLCGWWGWQVKETFYGVTPTQPSIILDAGHGGEDGGAVSLTGFKESDINLTIVLKLDQMLAFLGEPPLLVRDHDISLHGADADTLRAKKVADLKQRVSIADQYQNAVFVSIHQNSYPDSRYHGTQVFYAPTDGSFQLAQRIQQSVAHSLQPENNRKEKQIPDSVYLLNHIRNKAVLIECGFLTNPEEEVLLREESYQRKMSTVLAAALSTR